MQNSLKLTTTNHPIWCIVALETLKCCKLKDYFAFRKARKKVDDDVFALVRLIGARNKCLLDRLTGVSILSRLNLEKM